MGVVGRRWMVGVVAGVLTLGVLGCSESGPVGTEEERVLDIGGSFAYQHDTRNDQGFVISTTFEAVEVVDYLAEHGGKDVVARMTTESRTVGIVTKGADLFIRYESNNDRAKQGYRAVVRGTGYYFGEWLTLPAGSKSTRTYRFDTISSRGDTIGVDVTMRCGNERKVVVKEIEYDGVDCSCTERVVADGKTMLESSGTSTYVPEIGIITEARVERTDSAGVMETTESVLTSFVAPD